MALTLYLLRHGRTEGHEVRRYIGRTDVALDDIGRQQAVTWRERFGPGRFARVLCSDLSRSMETARIVTAGDPKPEAMPALAEIDLGDWDGRAIADVRREFPDLFDARGRDMAGFRPPGGESFEDVRERVAPVIEALIRDSDDGQGHDVLLAGHAGVNRVVLCHVLGLPLGRLFHLGQDHGCLNVIRWGAAGPVLRCLNLSPENTLPDPRRND